MIATEKVSQERKSLISNLKLNKSIKKNAPVIFARKKIK